MGALVTAMLHRFRLDGITRSENVAESTDIIPYGVNENSFFKHRLVLKYLVPSNNYQFPNESLTPAELCTLHFMMSHSFDRTQRGDEGTVCSKLSNYVSGRSSRVPRDARFRRQIEEQEAAEQSMSAEKETEQLPRTMLEVPSEDDDVVHETAEDDSKETSKLEEEAEENTEEEEKTEESKQPSEKENKDTFDAEVVVNHTAVSNESKSGKFIFDDDMAPPVARVKPLPKAKMVVTSTVKPQKSIDSPKTFSRSTTTVIQSDCPVEMGVVKTDWGAVALGSVLAGLAAGLFPQNVQVQNFAISGTRPLPAPLTTTLIDNKLAATLIGDAAEAALIQGPKNAGTIKIGTAGGWNDTLDPHWYFISEVSNNEMTDAEIRGGLDGLILGTKIENWNSLANRQLKLSEVLASFYSEEGIDTNYRACMRKDSYSEVAQNTVMLEQAYRFASVLDLHTFSAATMTDKLIKQFAENAVTELSSYVAKMPQNTCTSTQISPRATTSNANTALYANVTLVIDRSWTYKEMKYILGYLMDKLQLEEYGSRLTVLDGKTRAPFFNDSSSTLDLVDKFDETQYNTHETGIDIAQALEQELWLSMEGLLAYEKEQRIAGGRSTVVVFMPRNAISLSDNDLTIAKDKIKQFREVFPDVKFLYLAPGNMENYAELVDDPTKDFIQNNYQGTVTDLTVYIDNLVTRIGQVPLRVTNPTCGSTWQGESYNNGDFTHSVKHLGVNYHRISSNYLFGVGAIEIKVQQERTGDLKVCYSRKYEFPDNATSSTNNNDITCMQTSSTNVIKLENPCSGYEYIAQCPPLYISVSPVSTTPQYNCQDCRRITDFKYTISNQGLGCTSGVIHFLGNSYLIAFAVSSILLLRNLYSGS